MSEAVGCMDERNASFQSAIRVCLGVAHKDAFVRAAAILYKKNVSAF